jgi:hypothetical protein
LTLLDSGCFLFTKRGLTKAKEVTPSDAVLGVQHGKHAWKEGVTLTPSRAGLVRLYTDKTEIVCDERTAVFESSGMRSFAEILSSFETYGVHKLSIERATGLPISDIGTDSRDGSINGLSLSPEDYCVLGLMARRVPIYNGHIVLSVRNRVGQNVVDTLASLEGNSSFGRSAIRLKAASETSRFGWDWVILENQKLLGFLKAHWPTLEEIPTWARLTPFSNLEIFAKSAARVMIHEAYEDVVWLKSFEGETDVRQVIYAYGIGKGDLYEGHPVPLYRPCSVEIAFSKGIEDLGSTLIRAVSPRRDAPALDLQRPEPNWFPMVNLLPIA